MEDKSNKLATRAVLDKNKTLLQQVTPILEGAKRTSQEALRRLRKVMELQKENHWY